MRAGDFDYERHGAGYRDHRRPDPRIAAQLHARLGDAETVLNVGAGAGSYEPEDRYVVALEPSASMRSQRAPRRPAVIGVAEALPFDDGAFDAVMASITIHQWHELERGLRELRRVARRRVVLLTFDPARIDAFWLARYVPELGIAEAKRHPPLARIEAALGARCASTLVDIPLDCSDGFTEAFYGRPERLLEPAVRSAQSSWAFVEPEARERGLARLERSLADGSWDAAHGALRAQPTFRGALTLVAAEL